MKKKYNNYAIPEYTRNGYTLIKIDKHPHAGKDGCVYLHRWIVEKHVRRFLKSNEVVSHVNSFKDDNRIENLLLTSRINARIIHSRKIKSKSHLSSFFHDIDSRCIESIFGLRQERSSLFDNDYYQWHTQRQLKKLDKKRKKD